MRRETSSSIDGGMLIFGLLLGVTTGTLIALLTAPKSGRVFRQELSASVNETGQNLRATVESVVPSDPVAESMAEGKAAARRRRTELGLE